MILTIISILTNLIMMIIIIIIIIIIIVIITANNRKRKTEKVCPYLVTYATNCHKNAL